LTDPLRDEDIREIIISSKDLDEACQRLIGSAKEKGGRDNITVILAKR
jgi:serine/threonine protein phosphatase PrpC